MPRIIQVQAQRPDYGQVNALYQRGLEGLTQSFNPLQQALAKVVDNESKKQTGLLQQYIATHDPNSPEFKQGIEALRAQGSGWGTPDEQKLSESISNRFNQLSQLRSAELSQEGQALNNAAQTVANQYQQREIEQRLAQGKANLEGTNLNNQTKTNELRDYNEGRDALQVFSPFLPEIANGTISDDSLGALGDIIQQQAPSFAPKYYEILKDVNKTREEKNKEILKFFQDSGLTTNGAFSLDGSTAGLNTVGRAAATVPNTPVPAREGKSYSVGDIEALKTNGGEHNSQMMRNLFKGEAKGYGTANYRKSNGWGLFKGDVSKLTVGQVMQLQKEGKVFATGKYQIVPNTLREAVSTLGIDPNTPYDRKTQDYIFTNRLLGSKRPNIEKYIKGNGKITDAAIAMAAEWESFAAPNGKSMYDDSNYRRYINSKGNGRSVNASVSYKDVLGGLEEAKANYNKLISKGVDSDTAYQMAWLYSFNDDAPTTEQIKAGEQKLSQATPEVQPALVNPKPPTSIAEADNQIRDDRYKGRLLVTEDAASYQPPMSFVPPQQELPPGRDNYVETIPSSIRRTQEEGITQPQQQSVVSTTTPVIPENALQRAIDFAKASSNDLRQQGLQQGLTEKKREDLQRELQDIDSKISLGLSTPTSNSSLADVQALQTRKKELEGLLRTEQGNVDATNIEYKKELPESMQLAIQERIASAGTKGNQLKEAQKLFEETQDPEQKNYIRELAGTLYRDSNETTNSGAKLKSAEQELYQLENSTSPDETKIQTKRKEVEGLRHEADQELYNAYVKGDQEAQAKFEANKIPAEQTPAYAQLRQLQVQKAEIEKRLGSLSGQYRTIAEEGLKAINQQIKTLPQIIEQQRIDRGLVPIESLPGNTKDLIKEVISESGMTPDEFTAAGFSPDGAKAQGTIVKAAVAANIAMDKAKREALRDAKIMTVEEQTKHLKELKSNPSKIFVDKNGVTKDKFTKGTDEKFFAEKFIETLRAQLGTTIKKDSNGKMIQTLRQRDALQLSPEELNTAIYRAAVMASNTVRDIDSSPGFFSKDHEAAKDGIMYSNLLTRDRYMIKDTVLDDILGQAIKGVINERADKFNSKIQDIKDNLKDSFKKNNLEDFIDDVTKQDKQKGKKS